MLTASETIRPILIPQLHASLDRVVKITVCTRPFRAQGPRIEAERLGDKLLVHNYGHGGSGWSLSWGSGAVAVDLALSGRDPSQAAIAVIGCGALGLTAGILAQRAGARSVTIYAKDSPSESRSFRATGSWTPDSRVALASQAPAAFPAQWERMARASWLAFQSFLNLPGRPVEFNQRYTLSDAHPDVAEREKRAADPIGFALYRDRIRDLNPSFDDLPAGAHPFATQWARRHADMMFNITAYSQHLTEEFLANGGTIVTREFHAPSEFATLPQPVILHCTGYGARSLFDDASLTPVRGQIAWLPPQLEANYGLYRDNLIVLSRPDGIVVQLNAQGEASGWSIDDERPDRAEAEAAVHQLQSLYYRIAQQSY
jgi:glycine/D-amino acid oxidase-like deaminating enzyme